MWIVADVFESDITAPKVGDPAYVTFANAGTPSLRAKVSYMQPQVDPITRTLKVRLDASSPGARMKPDMFVNVEFGVAARCNSRCRRDRDGDGSVAAAADQLITMKDETLCPSRN